MNKSLAYISIIGIAAFVGNMLVIGLGFGTYWQTLDPVEFMKQFTLQFPNLLPPTMGILLPALIATIALVVKTKGQMEVRKNWSIALAGLVIACTITSVYHLPANLGFMQSKYSAEEALSKLHWWVILHWVRTIVVFTAAIFAVRAFEVSRSNSTT
ncbi:DUF1772 domain-containing protein [Neolewinella lacunae]|uniref:DUF1772 domain-containing protein n=1 Tax=Neolewinella lacunae TaxID=1517758 RepID=A0A923T8L7_9BACT|nr:DUF1772 domain-containing protein [Neolewinella lacunae]MBC6994093.1 DUF1772 domain-containing protein [Neolewinella lacunae]MDN3636758.1 DUF1772 domain-containing protein [Neolewinella lacunae]